MPYPNASAESAGSVLPAMKFLKLRDVTVIDEALQRVGMFGEVRLVVEHGRLRFVRTLKSEMLETAGLRPSDHSRE